ncbi:PA domain-containing protein [Colletotrichum orchidophilum]|uniref:PA domain-containing protein n=1 Tax=Colletotrichum orchidophilum TaxID=1209926 RepID=A0A1G4AXK3_9PEZI|nr:PA domain-containing protein [Colletotrichum orchidophilum]OHE93889.1 PA domain-containing protein [Colletotrichum orchidophilum]
MASGVPDASLVSVSASPADALYRYQNATNGYAAKITDDQANALRNRDDVSSVTLGQVYVLGTTRTPAFLGLDDASLLGRGLDIDPSSYLDERGDYSGIQPESNLIVGMLDTGVRPEEPSFKDDGMPPVPAHWKGKCEATDDFPATRCDKKLIGARAFYKGYEAANSDENGFFNRTVKHRSPRDDDGHGSHTSSTAAGVAVPNASLVGQASGTARGMAVHAHLSIYKVCWDDLSDILAGMDKAISDDVNVMSLSIGFSGAPRFDSTSIAGFAAVWEGIFVAQSAGNNGPAAASVVNVVSIHRSRSPRPLSLCSREAQTHRTLTVAASTLDRDFPAQVILGNGNNYTGTSLYSNGSVTDIKPLTPGEALPLVHASLAGLGNVTSANLCLEGSLDFDGMEARDASNEDEDCNDCPQNQ